MNKKIVLISLVAAVCLSAWAIYEISTNSEDSKFAETDNSSQVSELQEELEKLRALVASQKAYIDSLEERLEAAADEATRNNSMTQAETEDSNEGNRRDQWRRERREQMREFFQRDRATRMNSLLLTLSERLGLSGEQADILQAALQQWLEESMAEDGGGRRRFRGPFSVNRDLVALEETLDEILTPDQKAAYNDYKEEQKTNRVETVANMQLMDLQNSLDLTEQQKDAAFDAFADLAWEQADNPDNPGQSFRPSGEDFEKLIEALGPILTEEQMIIYEDIIENRKEFFRPPRTPPED